MNVFDRLLFWTMAQRGYRYPSELTPAMQRELSEARADAERLARKMAYIDAMAEGLGLKVPPRKDVGRAE